MNQLTSMEGYFNKKVRYKIESVHDFVVKLQTDKLMGYCRHFLAQDEPEWGGFRQLFIDFYFHVKEALAKDEILSEAVDENIEEIAEYVMFNMNNHILEYNLEPGRKLSQGEQDLERKIKMIEKAKPSDFGFKPDELTDTSWKSVLNEIKKIKEFKTPKAKLNQLGRAIGIIEHIFDLYRDTEVCADDLVNMLPYIIVRAKVPRFIAHARYIVYFHYTEEMGDVFSMYKTNLEVALERIAQHTNEEINKMSITAESLDEKKL